MEPLKCISTFTVAAAHPRTPNAKIKSQKAKNVSNNFKLISKCSKNNYSQSEIHKNQASHLVFQVLNKRFQE